MRQGTEKDPDDVSAGMIELVNRLDVPVVPTIETRFPDSLIRMTIVDNPSTVSKDHRV